MAKKKQEIEIAVNYKTNQGQVTKEMTEAEKEAKKLADQLKATEKAQDDLSKSTEQAGKAIANNSVVTETLDKVTGGLFTTVKNLTFGLIDGARNVVNYTKGMFSATTATGGLTTGMKLLRGALITTGIGAFVVALGTLVSYMTNAKKSTIEFIGSIDDLGDQASKGTSYAKKFAEAWRDANKATTETEIADLENQYKNNEISFKEYIKRKNELNNELLDIEEDFFNVMYEFDTNRSEERKKQIERDNKDNLQAYRDGLISREQYNLEYQKILKNFDGLVHTELKNMYNKVDELENSFYTTSVDKLDNTLTNNFYSWLNKVNKNVFNSYFDDIKTFKQKQDELINDLEGQAKDFEGLTATQQESLRKGIEAKRKELEIQQKLELEEKALELSRLDRARKREVENAFTLGIQEKFYALFNENEAKRIDDLEKNSDILNKTERFEATKLTNTYYNAQKDILTEKENLYNTWNSLDLEQFAIDMTNVGNTKGMTNFINKLMGIDDDLDKQLNQVKENVEARIDIIKSATIELQSYEIDKTRESQEKLAELRIDAIEKEREFKLLELEELKASEEEKEKVRQYYNTEMVREAENAQKALKEIDKRELAGKMALADGISSIFDSLSSQSKENGSIAKGLGIASVMIDTTVSAISAYKGMVEQFPGPVGIAAGAVAATAIGLNGLQAINKIKAVKVDGSENGGGGGSVATNQPNVSFVSSSENQIANTINATNENIADNPAEQEPIKAYVVSSDISTAQSLERNAINNSSL